MAAWQNANCAASDPVASVALASAVLIPPSYDDGWVLATVRGLARSLSEVAFDAVYDTRSP